MSHRLPVVKQLVLAELKLGQVVDVDRYTRVASAAFPDLDRKEIQGMILEVITQHGGGAAWGTAPLVDGKIKEAGESRTSGEDVPH